MNNIYISDARLNLLDLRVFLRDNIYTNPELIEILLNSIMDCTKSIGLPCNCWYNKDNNSIIIDFGKSKSITLKKIVYDNYINTVLMTFLQNNKVVTYFNSLLHKSNIIDTYNLILLNDQFTPNVVRMLYDITMVHNIITICL